MTYNCFGCGKEIDSKLVEKRLICPYCGYRIVVKARKKGLKQVKAR